MRGVQQVNGRLQVHTKRLEQRREVAEDLLQRQAQDDRLEHAHVGEGQCLVLLPRRDVAKPGAQGPVPGAPAHRPLEPA
ncbi:MAG TPA: hypothetical protein VFF36_10130, partial [Planctomycetota bacterium]|nr:hypothetical protein [Planctomycetota bacterium]